MSYIIKNVLNKFKNYSKRLFPESYIIRDIEKIKI